MPDAVPLRQRLLSIDALRGLVILFNAAGVVQAGGGILVDDAAFVPHWVSTDLIPLLADTDRVTSMATAAASVGVRDGAQRMQRLIHSAL